ncbi:MAG TPA: hypothetical protein VFD36_10420 [Kofleriaceae bacterium]|nr:hypothetical protein [Kofleriaceae bacterium]
MIAPLVWQVIWVCASGHGWGACGHRHATADEATTCEFDPDAAPVESAGLVRQVRDPAYKAPEQAYARGLARRSRQLELALEAG